MQSSSSRVQARPSRRAVGALVFLGLVAAATPAAATNTVSYIGSPPPPLSGVLLPATPTAADRVVHRQSLGRTFTNACYPASYSGPASVTVNTTTRVVRLDFDESQATAAPFCSGLFQPVDTLQLTLDPLPSGSWTLEVDRMLSAFPIGSIAPQTIQFTVADSGSAAVPIGSLGALATLLAVALGVGCSAIHAREHVGELPEHHR